MEWHGLYVAKHPDVYEPSDDTFLLARVVSESVSAGTRFLEVGCGAGLVSMAAARAGASVVCTDLNPHAVALARHNARENRLEVTAVEADLLDGVQDRGPFDVVAFNPPYLPTGPDDVVQGPLNLAFDGGTDGNAVVLRFADQVADLDPRPGVVLVVHSSLSNPEPLAARLAEAGYDHDVAARESHFFEQLWVRRFTRRFTRR